MTVKAPEKDWLSLAEAAEEVGCCVTTVRRWAKRRWVKSRNKGRGKTAPIYVHRSSVDRMKRELCLA